jgi:hypothetical protein
MYGAVERQIASTEETRGRPRRTIEQVSTARVSMNRFESDAAPKRFARLD